jgi:hypothetical protein
VVGENMEQLCGLVLISMWGDVDVGIT